MSRICLNCIHFEFDSGSRGYSELTPGRGMSLGCLKNLWDTDEYEGTGEIREKMKKAETCPEYVDYREESK